MYSIIICAAVLALLPFFTTGNIALKTLDAHIPLYNEVIHSGESVFYKIGNTDLDTKYEIRISYPATSPTDFVIEIVNCPKNDIWQAEAVIEDDRSIELDHHHNHKDNEKEIGKEKHQSGSSSSSRNKKIKDIDNDYRIDNENSNVVDRSGGNTDKNSNDNINNNNVNEENNNNNYKYNAKDDDVNGDVNIRDYEIGNPRVRRSNNSNHISNYNPNFVNHNSDDNNPNPSLKNDDAYYRSKRKEAHTGSKINKEHSKRLGRILNSDDSVKAFDNYKSKRSKRSWKNRNTISNSDSVVNNNNNNNNNFHKIKNDLKHTKKSAIPMGNALSKFENIRSTFDNDDINYEAQPNKPKNQKEKTLLHFGDEQDMVKKFSSRNLLNSEKIILDGRDFRNEDDINMESKCVHIHAEYTGHPTKVIEDRSEIATVYDIVIQGVYLGIPAEAYEVMVCMIPCICLSLFLLSPKLYRLLEHAGSPSSIKTA